MANVHEQIQAMIRKLIKQPTFELKRQLTTADVKGWDSMRHIQLMVEIDRQFKVRVEPKDIVRFKTFGDLVSFVEEKLAKVA